MFKISLPALLMLAVLSLAETRAADAPAPTTLSREEATSIKAYDLRELENKMPLLDGKVIRVKFNRRDTDVTRRPDGGLDGTLRLTMYRSEKYTYGNVPVSVPAAAVDWYMKISTQAWEMKMYAVLARVNGGKVELLGREIRTDSRGATIIW